MITGSIVALVTPMRNDGSLDFQAFEKLIEHHITQGSDGIVVVGTTGESPTVSIQEHVELIRIAVKCSGGRIPIIAGTGANSTEEAIALTRHAAVAGADAALSVAPYYNRPTQEGLYLHFRKIAESVELPLILYNVPSRTVADISNETTLRLAEIPNVVGIKDATGNIERGTDLILRAPENFAIYSGDDASACALLLLGAHGVISVTANVAPALMHQMSITAQQGNAADARAINARLFGLHRQLFCEANPIPVKWACQQQGWIDGALRLPLTSLSPENHARLRLAMDKAGVGV